jgi:hypothetical protein
MAVVQPWMRAEPSAMNVPPVLTPRTTRPRIAPGRPPITEGTALVKTITASSRTSSASKHRSTAGGLGPASTSSPACAPVRTATAVPTPTSQTASCQSAGGQRTAEPRAATTPPKTTTQVNTTASIREGTDRGTNRRPYRRCTATASTTAAATAMKAAAPRQPSGQLSAAPGTRAKLRATKTSHEHGTPAARPIHCAAVDDSGATHAVSTPRIVAGPTAGSASKFAGMDDMLTRPEIEAINGAHAIVAAVGTANASANHPGTRRAIRSRSGGATTSSDAVATTDKAKPALIDNEGSMNIRHNTAAHNAGNARRRRPVAKASTATSPIAAARSTLACGRATITNAAIASAPMQAWVRNPARHQRASTSTAPRTIATFAPETATMWVSPVVRNASARSGGNCDVSPSTSPGSSPRGPGESGAALARRPARNRPAARCVNEAFPTRVGAPRASKIAATNSPGCGAESRPTAVTCWLGCSDNQSSDVARITTGDLIEAATPEPVTRVARASSTTSGRCENGDAPGDDAPGEEPRRSDAADRCGSLVTTTTRVTVVPARASPGSGPRCTAATRQAAALAAPAAHTSPTPTTRRPTRSRNRATHNATAPIGASINAATSPTIAEHDNARAATSHALIAGTSNRNSAGSPGISAAAGRPDRPVTLSRARRVRRTSPARCPTPAAVERRW